MEGGNFNECLVIGSVISRNVQSLWIVQFLYHQYHSNTQYNMNDGWEDHKKLLNISVGLLSLQDPDVRWKKWHGVLVCFLQEKLRSNVQEQNKTKS